MSDSWLNPLLVVNRSMVFRHTPDDVAAARRFVVADDPGDAEAVVSAVHGRMKIAVTALGFGMPRSLGEIVQRGAGNCVSHSVLAAVLLRDRGVAARLVSENTYTSFSVMRIAPALLKAPVGPVLNSHVWLEVRTGGGWVPADAELGIFGAGQWLERRVLKGVTVRALGLPASERWRFPLRIRRLAEDGQPFQDATGDYLLGSLERVGLAGGAVPEGWRQGVRYFSEEFDWTGRAGLRIWRARGHLARMSAGRRKLAASLARAGNPA